MPGVIVLQSADRASMSPAAIASHDRWKTDKRSLDYILRSGLAGGAAGCAAKTLIAPLDRVKILFQASSPQFAKYTGTHFGVARAVTSIVRTDGVAGLFRGHSATLLRIFPYAATKFVAYEQFRACLITRKEQETAWRRLLAGSAAGVTSVFCTYPLEVIRVRLAFETGKDGKSSLRRICSKLWSEGRRGAEGLMGFYRGFGPTVLGMLPYAGMSFLTHDIAGDWLRAKKGTLIDTGSRQTGAKPQLKAWAELSAGGFAGVVGQTASYPLEVIRRRMQVGGAVGDGRLIGIAETTRDIWRTGGFRGFFVGLSIGYVKVIPMVATSFYVYERCKTYLGIP